MSSYEFWNEFRMSSEMNYETSSDISSGMNSAMISGFVSVVNDCWNEFWNVFWNVFLWVLKWVLKCVQNDFSLKSTLAVRVLCWDNFVRCVCVFVFTRLFRFSFVYVFVIVSVLLWKAKQTRTIASFFYLFLKVGATKYCVSRSRSRWALQSDGWCSAPVGLVALLLKSRSLTLFTSAIAKGMTQ